jgi:hypothetical protein
MLNLFQHLNSSTSIIKTLKQVQGDGCWNGRFTVQPSSCLRAAVSGAGRRATNGRIEAATDSVTAGTLHRPNNNEISRVLAGTNGVEARCSRRQILPKPVWKLLVNRHFNAPLNAPFNDSTRLSGGLSRDYDRHVAFV